MGFTQTKVLKELKGQFENPILQINIITGEGLNRLPEIWKSEQLHKKRKRWNVPNEVGDNYTTLKGSRVKGLRDRRGF